MDPSASIYGNFALYAYDFLVLRFCNYFTWLCPTGSVLLPFFQKHIGVPTHLDVGVGSGYYHAKSVSELARTTSVALLDLNPVPLRFTAGRMRRAGYTGKIELVEQDVFKPLPARLHARFNAISVFYLLHCLPGPLFSKAHDVFARVTPALAPGGVVYGATILGRGRGVRHNWVGGRFMALWNGKGALANTDDTVDGLEDALRGAFAEWGIRQVGNVVLFQGRKPLH